MVNCIFCNNQISKIQKLINFYTETSDRNILWNNSPIETYYRRPLVGEGSNTIEWPKLEVTFCFRQIGHLLCIYYRRSNRDLNRNGSLYYNVIGKSGGGRPWTMVPEDIKVRYFGDTWGIPKPTGRHFRPSETIANEPNASVPNGGRHKV